MPSSYRRRAVSGRGRSMLPRLAIAAVIVLFSIVSYYTMSDENPVTGESQRVALSTEQEVAMGLRAAPQMVQQHEGLLANSSAQQHVDRIGAELLEALELKLAAEGRQNPYPFEFHLLADNQTLNAFALPGGQVFITAALYQY